MPNSLGTAALRARWLRAKGQTDKIEPLLEPLAEKTIKRLPKNSPAEAKLLRYVGACYSALDQHKAAERWYRRLVAMWAEELSAAGRLPGAAGTDEGGPGSVPRGGEI